MCAGNLTVSYIESYHQPHPHVKKKYGAKEQIAKPLDKTPLLDKAGKKFIQEVTGVF